MVDFLVQVQSFATSAWDWIQSKDIDFGDVATWVAAGIALIALKVAKDSARDSKKSASAATISAKAAVVSARAAAQSAKSAGAQTELMRESNQLATKQAEEAVNSAKKTLAYELAQDWLREEAPSPLSALNNWLAEEHDREQIERLLSKHRLIVPAAYSVDLQLFFRKADPAFRNDFITAQEDTHLSSQAVAVIHDFFVRRINFLDTKLVAYCDGQADKEVLHANLGDKVWHWKSLHIACELKSGKWPNLKAFLESAPERTGKRQHKAPEKLRIGDA